MRNILKFFVKTLIVETILRKDWELLRSKLNFYWKPRLRAWKPKKTDPFSEADFFRYAFRDKPNGLMVDVGGHYGESLATYAWKGWDVHSFEPDPSISKQDMLKRYASLPNVSIHQLALSDKESEATFYSSDQSTGIASLNPFHDSHKSSATVPVTTFTSFIKENPVGHINFLKIDTEGYDLMVLKGFPWEDDQPDVILCEFEDNKTLRLGYSYKDLGDFLISKGYTVFLSEWCPIVEYGKPQSWKSISPYPKEVEDEKAWGNFLAFKDKRFEKELADYLTFFNRDLGH